MTEPSVDPSTRQPWIEPEIRELDVRETFAKPEFGVDSAGNPWPDCQAS